MSSTETSGDRARLARLAAAVVSLLRGGGATLALAESCTGGLIATAITDIPGASEILWGGAVVYSPSAKTILGGLDAATVAAHGTVSAPTTEALAVSMRRRAGATYGLAVTGWAGPRAGEGAAVGDVHAAVSDASGVALKSTSFAGDRSQIRQRAAIAALGLLRERFAQAQDGRG